VTIWRANRSAERRERSGPRGRVERSASGSEQLHNLGAPVRRGGVQRRSVVAVARGDIAVRREQALGDVDVIALCSDEQRRHAFDSAAQVDVGAELNQRSDESRVAVMRGGQQCRVFAAARIAQLRRAHARVEERVDGKRRHQPTHRVNVAAATRIQHVHLKKRHRFATRNGVEV